MSALTKLGADALKLHVACGEAKKPVTSLATEAESVTTLLDRYRGNVTKAAAAAGLSSKHLHDLMKKIELASTEPDE